MKKSLLVIGALFASLMPMLHANAASEIALLNPSPYTTAMQLSDKMDTNTAYHLVAWVKDVPASPFVEFEIQATGQNATTIDGARVGSTDTWEAFISLAGFTDGQYFVRTRLYSNLNEVSNDERIVVLNRADVPPPPTGETAEITYPENGGELGFFTPKNGRPVTVIDVTTSDMVEQVRGFYTLSDPGAEPEWTSCGAAEVSDTFTAQIRCTLAEGHARNDVTGVAIVANRTIPPAPPQEQADETGDAHRVFPYGQTPTFVEIDPEAVSANPGECQTFTAYVSDQKGRTIPAANVDVHAEGPNDQLRFGSISGTTSPFQAPEDSSEHPSRENAIKCSDGTTSGQQGDHNKPGQNDIKHIESTEGTSNTGAFVFALRADAMGSTVIDVWAEEDDDDVQDSSEGAGGARVGWGEPPPPPEIELSMSPSSASSSQGSCKAITLVAKEGGNPLGGTNADVHITGPDQTVNFCDPPDADPRRAPDAGGHVVDSHEDGTRHAEGETDAQGTFTFGVISSTVGTTQVLAWIDAFDDDLQDGSEESASGSITWEPAGERDVSIDTNKDKVDVGGKVKIFGSISGDSSCESSQEVKLKARKRGGKFKTIETDTTDADGDYSFQIEVRKTKDYRVLAPAAGICEKTKSSIVTVKAR